MDSYVIELTPAAHRHGNLNIRPCGLEFFPKGILGGSTKTQLGTQVTLKPKGLSETIRTDIPTDKTTGRPRWLFRERSWVKQFVRANNLVPGDKVVIRRISRGIYELAPRQRKLRFIDLFAGIGGMRLAFEKAGCRCVFSSEWDKFAQQTYEANFGEKPAGNIREIAGLEILGKNIPPVRYSCKPDIGQA